MNNTPDEIYQMFLSWRSVETPCKACSGTGGRAYGSTATWSGGIGGQMMTHSVCDKCWGSGDAESPWADLRHLATEADRMLDFARHVYSAPDTPAHLHDAAAKLLNLPSLAHGCDKGEEV